MASSGISDSSPMPKMRPVPMMRWRENCGGTMPTSTFLNVHSSENLHLHPPGAVHTLPLDPHVVPVDTLYLLRSLDDLPRHASGEVLDDVALVVLVIPEPRRGSERGLDAEREGARCGVRCWCGRLPCGSLLRLGNKPINLSNELWPSPFTPEQVGAVLPVPDVVLDHLALVPALRRQHATRKRRRVASGLRVVDVGVDAQLRVVGELVAVRGPGCPCHLIEWCELDDLLIIHHEVEADIGPTGPAMQPSLVHV